MHVLLFVVALAVSPEFEVRVLGDQTIVGSLLELDGKHATLQTGGGQVSLETGKLVRIAARQKPPAPRDEPAVWIELADGSVLRARDYAASGGQARFGLAAGQSVELPAKMVAAVRLQAETTALAAQWQRILGGKPDADLLVVRKGESLDYHKGVLRDIDDKTVQFAIDGETLPVKRARVYGLLYYRPPQSDLPEAFAQLTDSSGAQWAVRTFALAGGKIEWTTPAGLTVVRPLAEIDLIDFSGGKIVYLSDLKAESSSWSPYFGTAKAIPALEQFYAPRQDKNLESKPIQLGGTEYPKGLAFHSRTEVVYRLPERFSKLKAIAGIDDGVRPHGNVRLVIRGDDRTLLEMTVTGTEAPKPIDLDIAGVRRLSILVDFGEETDVGDHLDLAEARLIK